MEKLKSLTPQVPSAAACAEAAAWIARLHGEDRTSAVEQGFRTWLAASAEHRAAFEMANDVWSESERWPRPRPKAPGFLHRPGAAILLPLPRLALAATVLLAMVVGAFFYFRDRGIATQIGETRNLTLTDGTRVALNTATRIRVAYDDRARRVFLERGEALFEVAGNPRWPFIVTAGEKQVTALGTAFLVRRDELRVVVTLVEGKVAIAPAPRSGFAYVAAGSAKTQELPITLTPGERLTFASGSASPRLDRPSVSQVMAWERGQVILDHTSLATAVEEMNRYSEKRLVVDDPGIAALEVTGVFRAGDSVSFAQAVAAAYRLQVIEESGRLRLTR